MRSSSKALRTASCRLPKLRPQAQACGRQVSLVPCRGAEPVVIYSWCKSTGCKGGGANPICKGHGTNWARTRSTQTLPLTNSTSHSSISIQISGHVFSHFPTPDTADTCWKDKINIKYLWGKAPPTCEKMSTSSMWRAHCICHHHQPLLPAKERQSMRRAQQFSPDITAQAGAAP